MALDEEATKLLGPLLEAGLPRMAEISPTQLRAMYALAPKSDGEDVTRVIDLKLPGPAGPLPLRIYYPKGPGPHPVTLYLHGGGWVVGNIELHDGSCRALTNASDVAIASLDYRLAPEAPYPAATEDSYAALLWLVANAAEHNLDPARIAVAGDSAGGNISAAICLMVRDRGGPQIRHQLLIYPATHHGFDFESYKTYADDGGLLSTEMMIWFWGHYLEKAADGDEVYASPLRAKDLSGLPPATVITAEHDPLRDEGELYAKRLIESGVETVLTRYSGMFHGFFAMASLLTKARAATNQAGAALRSALTS